MNVKPPVCFLPTLFKQVLLALASFGVLGSAPARAVSVDWDNEGADGMWNTPGNWSSNVVPIAPDDAVFINEAAGPASISETIPVPRDIRIGDENRPGSGTINHTAGEANLTGWFRMGVGAGTGTYNLSGGQLTAGRFNVSEVASTMGTINVSGGTLRQNDTDNSDATWNRIGEQGVAEFNISGDSMVSLHARTLFAGAPGSSSVITQTAGLFEIRVGDMTLADNGGATYNISGGTLRTLNTSSESLVVGQWDNSQGNLNVSGTALVEVGGDLVVGNGNPGNAAPATGVVTHDAGTVRVGTVVGGGLRIGVDPEANGTYHLNGGILDLTGGTITYGAGTHSFNFNGGRLEDVLSTNFALFQAGGTLAPGSSGAGGVPGTTSIGGDYTMSSGSTLEIDLLAATAGSFDAVSVTGAVLLNGAVLDLIPRPGLAIGNTFLIIDNDDSTDMTTGTFAGKPELGTFSEDGYEWDITYAGGDGNDTLVTVVPEPTAIAALLGGVTLSALLARRRRVA